MQAHAGDRIVIRRHRGAGPRRDREVLDATDDLLVELVGSLADLVVPSTAATAGTS
jgi:hypothetical protein